MNRLVVLLDQNEFSALLKMASQDLRNPADELRHILRLAMEQYAQSQALDEEHAQHNHFTTLEVQDER